MTLVSSSLRYAMLVALVCFGTLLVVGGSQFAIVEAQVGDQSSLPPPLPLSANLPAEAPSGVTFPVNGGATSAEAPRQVVMQLMIMELDALKLAEAKFDLASELGIERGPQPDPETRPPLVARLKPRELRLLTRSLTLAKAGKIISRPAIVTLDGRKASVHTGGELPLIQIEQTINGKREMSLESRAFGTFIELTPHFRNPTTLDVTWNAESSRLVREDEKLPRLLARTLRGTGTCAIGESLVVADVPIVANNDSTEGEIETGLLFFITPELVNVDKMPSLMDGASTERTNRPPLLPRTTPLTPLPAGKGIVELPLEGDVDLDSLHLMKPGARVKLIGRERLGDGGLGEDEHAVFEDGVIVHGVRSNDGRPVLLLKLSQKEAERLQLAREHCQLSLALPTDLTSDKPLAARQPQAAPTPPIEANALPKRPTPIPPQDELRSLRDEVRELRKEIQRVVELLEARQAGYSDPRDLYETIRNGGKVPAGNLPQNPYANGPRNVAKEVASADEFRGAGQALSTVPTSDCVLFFTADWCHACETWRPYVRRTIPVSQKLVEIDILAQPRLTEKFAIKAIPTLVVLREGKEVDRIVGMIGAAELAKRFAEEQEQTPASGEDAGDTAENVPAIESAEATE